MEGMKHAITLLLLTACGGQVGEDGPLTQGVYGTSRQEVQSKGDVMPGEHTGRTETWKVVAFDSSQIVATSKSADPFELRIGPGEYSICMVYEDEGARACKKVVVREGTTRVDLVYVISY